MTFEASGSPFPCRIRGNDAVNKVRLFASGRVRDYDTRMRFRLDPGSLHVRVTIMTLMIVGASLLLADLIDRHYVSELARENLHAKTVGILRSFDLKISKRDDLRGDLAGAQELATLYEENPDILLLQVYVSDGGPTAAPVALITYGDATGMEPSMVPREVREVLATGQKVSRLGYDAAGHRMSLAVPIRAKQQVVGALYAEVWTAQFDSLLAHHRTWSITIRILAGVLIVLAINLFLYFHVHRPLRRLQSAVTAVAKRDLTTSVPVERQDEIGLVGAQFNLMVEQLRLVAEENRRLYEALKEANDSLQGRVAEATSELLKRNQELEELNDVLSATQRETARVQRLAVLGQTVATVAHRIGTPLTGISGHIQLLAEDQSLSDAVRSRVTTVTGQIERLSRVIEDLLTLARKPDPPRTQVDVNAVLEQVLNLFRPAIEQQRIELVTEFSDTLPPITADGTQLHEVFTNLIDNALDAMPKGGRLMIRTHHDESSTAGVRRRLIVAEIGDTGTGIDPRHRDRVFEPFFTTKPSGLGTGLGLAIAKEAIRLHGGQITMTSEVGKGTCIKVSLPVTGEPR